MQRLARWIARKLWWVSLWLMRRGWMRRLQAASVGWMSPEKASRARLNLVRQNAFARRIGLRLLTFVVTLFLISLAIQFVYSSAIYLVESGVLRPTSLAPED
ncbi:hypothetical protein EON82_05330 [bacterium]|nr:MAG: hypothetical protein EON82_05330 [bacterium]